jgi:hypothetical protein
MPTFFEKLNLKDQNEVVILNAPLSYGPEITLLKDVMVYRSLETIHQFGYLMALM